MPERKIPKMDIPFKLQEPNVQSSDPWADDRLDRRKMAEKLTELVRSQSEPFTVSITGSWGSGKTFFLKRWQQNLENEKACVVYFNAWEDDYHDDPLVVIFDQLIDIAKENKLVGIPEDIWEHVKILTPRNIESVVNKFTGLRISVPENQRTIDYKERKNSKAQVTKLLVNLSEKLRENRQYPLIFIIDELDRCRPLFAIELLERVKHILGVKDIVFVFGINRIELSKSIQSIYGEINSDSYLMRFFDMEFVLPCPDMNAFLEHLYDKYALPKVQIDQGHQNTRWSIFSHAFPIICSVIGLSLRDVEHCIRIVKFAVVSQRRSNSSAFVPGLLSVLTVLKVKNRMIYQEFLQGECSGAKVMNYINQFRSPNINNIPEKHINRAFDIIELLLYSSHFYATHTDFAGRVEEIIPFKQLDLLGNGSTRDQLPHPEVLADATISAEKERISDMIEIRKYLCDGDPFGEICGDRFTLRTMFELIELTNLPEMS